MADEPQNHLTDDDILAAAAQLAKQVGLNDDQRNSAVLMVQRLVWPPSPYEQLHETSPIIVSGGRAASGELRCVHGCARAWRVNHAPDRSAVYDALMAAHAEYRTGRITSEAVPEEKPQGRRVSLAEVFGRSVAVEVTDERITS